MTIDLTKEQKEIINIAEKSNKPFFKKLLYHYKDNLSINSKLAPPIKGEFKGCKNMIDKQQCFKWAIIDACI